jgi:hypothetical protein
MMKQADSFCLEAEDSSFVLAVTRLLQAGSVTPGATTAAILLKNCVASRPKRLAENVDKAKSDAAFR